MLLYWLNVIIWNPTDSILVPTLGSPSSALLYGLATNIRVIEGMNSLLG